MGVGAWRRAVGLLALAPALGAVWAVEGFVTQDGPAHLYNAEIIAAALRGDSPFRGFYQVRWDPLPNWAGHLGLIGLRAVLPARAADRAMMSLTLVGFAASVAWLRGRVTGGRGRTIAWVWATVLGLNVTWLLGFSGFLLGGCLFPITLGVWWSARERLNGAAVARLAGLLVLGYFAHLVSLGLTVAGLLVLAASTPGPGHTRRWLGTLASLAPLGPLGWFYHHRMRAAGGIAPIWGQLDDPFALRSWAAQLAWADPISLGSKAIVPFVAVRAWWWGALAPVFWFLAALGLFLARPARERRGWAILGALLVLGGLVGPDTLGETHGNYLPQRVVLLGLVALGPVLEFDLSRRGARLGTLVLLGAWALQSAQVWDYALDADARVGPLLRVREAVGRRQRVGTLLIGIRGRYRANPLLHADSLLGVGTGNIVWSNYETTHYYFPVQFRADVPRPPAAQFERVALLDSPGEDALRAERWRQLIEAHHEEIDVLVVWGSDPRLDALNARWFDPEPVARWGQARVLRHRSPRG
jgi:hypothetical protein